MSSSIVTSFLGALQASIAVLLTIFYGAIAAQFSLLSESSAKEISKTCVRMFLPALLITNVGSQLHLDTGMRYVPVLIYAIAYNALSMGMGMLCTKIFRMPSWVTPAIAFNNTTSLPLLLVQSLNATGILSSLLMSSSDTSSDAIARAKSYFLVNAMVGNSLTFALGPKLLNGHEEDAPDSPEKKDKKNRNNDNQADGANGDARGRDEEEGGSGEEGDDDSDHAPDEQTSLLPNRVNAHIDQHQRKAHDYGKHYWDKLSPRAQSTLDFLYQFLNAPLIGAVIGAIIGLAPPLHKAFFAPSHAGGIFNAWLTSSIQNVGDLFAALQVIVVGVKLSQAMRKQKEGQASGEVPWRPMVFVWFVRFVLWPLISIPLIWVLATKTNWLTQDPILWFAMMLMPTGPPAMKLTALADVNGSGEQEKMAIAKFLTISYAISPLLCFAVVGSLRASEAAVGK